ncbi:replicase [Tomato necrotic streak virus]|uniref:Replication protein 1a n=2 Tax=Tomato necrotic streak virus TaxID=1637492 RepID=A0A140GPI5_9BROM|nr:replicase [Tomato necrotic streak virus]AMN16528.1 replicase [Tomato necrotic streak virus]
MDSIVEHHSNVLRLDDLLNDVVRRNAANASTEVGRIISDAAVKVVKRQVDLTPAKPLNVSFALTPEDQNALRRDFPGREMQFRNSATSSHAFAAAHRVCETDYIYSRFQTESTTIIDIGGNFCTHAKMGRDNVHSCCPILDVRDGARYTDRFLSIAGALEKQPERELRLNYCDHKFEDCDVSAPWAMAIHSISDIPITTVVKHCFRRGVKKLIASVMMDPMMLLATEGFIPRLNVKWEVETIGKKREISFHFIDAPGLSYTHNYDVLMQYMTCNQVIVSGKAAYRVERVADLSGVFIVEITLASTNKDRLDLIPMRDVSCAWMSSLRRKTLVRIAIPQLKNSWEIKHVIMDTDFVRRVAEVSFRQYKSETPIENLVQSVATMISSASNHCIINGVTMQTGSPVPIDYYVPLAVPLLHTLEVVTTWLSLRWKWCDREECPLLTQMLTLTLSMLKEKPFPQKDLCRRPLKGFSFPRKQKVDDNTMLLYSCPILESIVDEIKSALGWDVWATDDAVIQSLPSFYKMEDVFEVTSEHYCLSHTLNVDYWLEGLYDSYDELRKVHQQKLLEEEARKTKVEKALLKIAEVLESDDCPKGLLPLKVEPLVASLIEKKTDEIVTRPQCSDASKPHINPYADAIKEAMSYYHELEVVATRNLRGVGDYLGWRTKSNYSAVWGGDESRCVLEPLTRRWFNRVKSVEYERGMTVDGFVHLAWKNGDLTPDTWATLSKYNVLLFDSTCIFDARSRLIPGLEKALTMDCKASVVIEDGVAGCGKTTSLLKQTKIETDILLSANRETAKDARESGCIPEVMKYRVRTLDSYLMLKRWFTAERLLVDECFLVHSGIIYAAATLGQVKEIIAFGDTKQIPFVSRIPTFGLKHPSIKGVLKPKLITYRCPRDATAILSEKFYKQKVKTFNPIASSVSLININSGMEIPAEKDTLYIMHTQADKCAMLRHPGINVNNVMTTHEAQGKTFDNVILVRLSKTTNLLYSGKMPDAGPSHNLVALSRHRKTLRYFSVYADDPDDIITSGIRWSKTLDEQELAGYRASS